MTGLLIAAALVILLMMKEHFCPNCGADMRGETNDL